MTLLSGEDEPHVIRMDKFYGFYNRGADDDSQCCLCASESAHGKQMPLQAHADPRAGRAVRLHDIHGRSSAGVGIWICFSWGVHPLGRDMCGDTGGLFHLLGLILP